MKSRADPSPYAKCPMISIADITCLCSISCFHTDAVPVWLEVSWIWKKVRIMVDNPDREENAGACREVISFDSIIRGYAVP